MEPGRPVGGTYYLYRTLRQLDLDDIQTRLMQEARERGEVDEGELADRLAHEEYQARLKELRELIEEEIRRRLVADRGVEAMARTLRKPLPEDIEFMHASREEMLALQQAVLPAHPGDGGAARAATAASSPRAPRLPQDDPRVAVVRRRARRPEIQEPHPSKPEIMVVADISGSVASFARFTLQFVYAMASQFSKVRSWVFIDGIDEVTKYFQESEDVTDAVQRVNTEADVIWVDGHSDYGHAFETWHQRHFHEITPKTSIILLGDARNNYHASEAWVVDEMRKRGRHGLLARPRAARGTGTPATPSSPSTASTCDGVFECRNLRQLTQFVGTIAEG